MTTLTAGELTSVWICDNMYASDTERSGMSPFNVSTGSYACFPLQSLSLCRTAALDRRSVSDSMARPRFGGRRCLYIRRASL